MLLVSFQKLLRQFSVGVYKNLWPNGECKKRATMGGIGCGGGRILGSLVNKIGKVGYLGP